MKNTQITGFFTDEQQFFEAIFNSDLGFIAHLLQQNKSLANAISPTSKNPALHIAVNKGDAQIVQLLLDNQADVNLKAQDKLPILHRAAIYRRKDLIEPLVQAKADINAKDSYHSPILFHAAAKGYYDMVDLLLNLKAAVNISDNYGVTALHCTIINGNIKVVELLLSAKADIQQKTVEGKMALHAAAAEGQVEVIGLILQANADIDAQDNNGNTALHIAAAHMRTENIKFLLAAKADPSICDKAGYSAADYIYKWNPDLIQILAKESKPIEENISKIEPQISIPDSSQVSTQTEEVIVSEEQNQREQIHTEQTIIRGAESNLQVNDSSRTLYPVNDIDVIGDDLAVSQACFIL